MKTKESQAAYQLTLDYRNCPGRTNVGQHAPASFGVRRSRWPVWLSAWCCAELKRHRPPEQPRPTSVVLLEVVDARVESDKNWH